MRDFCLNKDNLEEPAILYSEPVLAFDENQSDFESNKKKINGLVENGPWDNNADQREFDKINIIPVINKNADVGDSLNEVLLRIKQSLWMNNRSNLGFEDIFECELAFPSQDNWYTAESYDRDEFERIGRQIVEEYNFRRNSTRNIVVFVTDSTEDSPNRLEFSAYNGLKKILLEDFLPSQCLSESRDGIIYQSREDSEKLSRYSLINIALQIYAKVGGVPWTLEPAEDNSSFSEISVGIRASVPKNSPKNYAYGIAQIFSKHGKWVDSVVEEGNISMETDRYDLTADSIFKILNSSKQKYESKILSSMPFDDIHRINVHKLGGFSDSEIAGAKEFADKTNIEITLVGIQDSNIRVFSGAEDDVGNARRGYMKELNENTAVLCTTGDHDYGEHKDWFGTPKPVVVHVYDDEKLSSPEIKDAAQDIFYLTAINWDDATNREVSKPVTLNYARRVSKKVSDGIDITKISEDVPWFL